MMQLTFSFDSVYEDKFLTYNNGYLGTHKWYDFAFLILMESRSMTYFNITCFMRLKAYA